MCTKHNVKKKVQQSAINRENNNRSVESSRENEKHKGRKVNQQQQACSKSEKAQHRNKRSFTSSDKCSTLYFTITSLNVSKNKG